MERHAHIVSSIISIALMTASPSPNRDYFSTSSCSNGSSFLLKCGNNEILNVVESVDSSWSSSLSLQLIVYAFELPPGHKFFTINGFEQEFGDLRYVVMHLNKYPAYVRN